MAEQKVTLGGRELVCHPLNLKDLRQFNEIILGRKEGQSTFDHMDAMSKVILASLNKGGQDITADFIDENVNFVNYMEVVKAVMSASGLRQQEVAVVEKPAVGESQPAPPSV